MLILNRYAVATYIVQNEWYTLYTRTFSANRKARLKVTDTKVSAISYL